MGEESSQGPGKKHRKLFSLATSFQENVCSFPPTRKLPASGQYVARVVMQNIIKALAKPDDTTPGEHFCTRRASGQQQGITPYSVGGNVPASSPEPDASKAFLAQTESEGLSGNHGAPITRVFLGASADRIGTRTQMYHLHKPCLRRKHDDVSLSETEISDPGLLYWRTLRRNQDSILCSGGSAS